MIDYKTPQEIEIMRKGGKILSDVLWEVLSHAKPGVSEIELDQMADRLIKEKGGEPGFKMVDGYKYATCISTNEVVVHGIPTEYKLQEGDIIGIDCGVYYQGFHTDMSHSIKVKNQNSKGKILNEEKIDRFLEIGEKALNAGVNQAVNGNRIGHISKAIQDIVEKEGGYSVVRSLIGHGVGRQLHEEPEVPGYLEKPVHKTPILKKGMTIAIEVIYNMGGADVSFSSNNDGWTIVSADGSLSGLYERTVEITDKNPVILT